MINLLTSRLQAGATYVKDHPNLIGVLVVMLLLPLLLFYTNEQYLTAGLQNQDRLQKDRVGLLHDTFGSLLFATNFDAAIAQREIDRLASLNPDIIEFVIARSVRGDIIPIAALERELINQPVENPQFYQNALVRIDESLIFPAQEAAGRQWYTYRALQTDVGELYFVYTKFSLAAVDTAFTNNTAGANWSFIYIYGFIALLALWHIKLTDYHYLYRQVKEANHTKDLFTNTMAHELRAPLTAMRGYASMIEEKTDTEIKEQASRIRESSERLLAIVNDLLDVARIQSGKLAVELVTTDVSILLKKVGEELSVSAADKSITLVYEGVETEQLARVDEKRLHQAVTNLLSNAIKYTKEGTITLAVEDIGTGVEVRIKDTGMGISAEDQKQLFAPFFRVQSDNVSQITGTGLGMWITKQLIELMNGKIAVESIKGVGTHVVITLPKT